MMKQVATPGQAFDSQYFGSYLEPSSGNTHKWDAPIYNYAFSHAGVEVTALIGYRRDKWSHHVHYSPL